MPERQTEEQTTLHNRVKLWLAHTLKLDHAALHAHLGMAIWLACVLIAGDAGALWPLLVVIAAECINEILDRLRNGSWMIADTLQDIAGTLIWPCVLFGMARGGLL